MWKFQNFPVISIFRYSLEKEVRNQVLELSPKHFHRHALSNVHMENFLQIEHSDSKDGALLVDTLQTVVNKGDEDRDLTSRYYGKQVTQFIRHQFLSKHWEEFKEREVKDQNLYQGLIMIAQWFQPLESISLNRVQCDVLHIAMGTVEKLKDTHPNHPIFQLKDEEIFVKNKNLTEDRFGGGKNSLAILDALNDFMFKSSGFRGNTANYYNPANSYIDKVLQSRQGIPITLCLLYKLVANRLGIVIEAINFPRHFLLKWVDTSKETSYYIDTFRNGARKSMDEIKAETDQDPEQLAIAKPMEIFQRMVRNLGKYFTKCFSNQSTVCKFLDFSTTQILREINFGESRGSKTVLGLCNIRGCEIC